ncbi:MAG TPA: MBL fold metallo-hydrolase [Gaiellaceae bacterium]|jgi:ribonuclease BN (tRNA processing enzyme)|nr:MBL fold metallo-hydrolase [Gaiellaceae bacterium]
MTTRIFLVMVRQYMDVRLTVIGSSPAWPNPGGAQSGYLLEADGTLLLDCGPGVLGRLREHRLRPDAIAITHFHLDHWGDLVPWAWLNAYGPQEHRLRCALWLPPGGTRELTEFAARWGNEGMFETGFEMREFDGETPFQAAGFAVQPCRLPHYTVTSYGFRVSCDGRTLAYSGDSGPTAELAGLARGADLFLCEATLAESGRDGVPRGHLTAEEALAAADGPILLTHRPVELPAPAGVQVAHDGLVVDV